jgi:hypothetical protein
VLSRPRVLARILVWAMMKGFICVRSPSPSKYERNVYEEWDESMVSTGAHQGIDINAMGWNA